MINGHELLHDAIRVFVDELRPDILEKQVDVVTWLVICQHIAIPIENPPPRRRDAHCPKRLDFKAVLVLLARDNLDVVKTRQEQRKAAKEEHSQPAKSGVGASNLVNEKH